MRHAAHAYKRMRTNKKIKTKNISNLVATNISHKKCEISRFFFFFNKIRNVNYEYKYLNNLKKIEIIDQSIRKCPDDNISTTERYFHESPRDQFVIEFSFRWQYLRNVNNCNRFDKFEW